ncbi:MAG: dTDP-4-dehydrorhamnose reductase [Bacteroidales bacterium]|nr:dTDP-4-dehydrorhamnose reductase [Bacteroidales bacterium]
MNILITGSKGQLGSEIQNLSSDYSKYNFFYTDIEELDITNFQAVDDFFKINNIACVINCAAYTAVDKAEEDNKMAMLINSNAVKYLSQVSARYNSLLIHISTDYVFDGKSHRPYIENDKVNPTSFYGKTKLEGENQIIANAKKALIIRTSWLYSEFGNNFVKTMIKYGRERKSLKVVFDQIGTPTYARDLSKVLLDIISQTHNVSGTEIYHYSNEGVISWYDFAKAIMELAEINCKIYPIETKDYSLPAPRPFYSVLNKTKIKDHFNLYIPYWKDSLDECLHRIHCKKI